MLWGNQRDIFTYSTLVIPELVFVTRLVEGAVQSIEVRTVLGETLPRSVEEE